MATDELAWLVNVTESELEAASTGDEVINISSGGTGRQSDRYQN